MASFNRSSEGPGGLADVNPVRTRPLVGRAHELDLATQALRSGSTAAVLLVAEAGAGKSTLAEAIAAALSEEFIVMRVHGSPSLSNVPYGVLAPYLVDLPEDPTSSHIAILRAFWAQFERLREGRKQPLLLLVDDAHELDEATANVIVDLITANWAKVVASARPRPGLPAPMMQLWYDSMAERIDLGHLGRDDVGEVCENLLGAPVLASTVQFLWAACEGNPLLLTCLVEDARAAGILAKRNGVWILNGALATDGPALTGFVRNQLLRRTPQERDALTMIALAEPVSMEALEEDFGVDLLQNLVENQLLAASGGGDMLRLRHPIYAEAIRSMVSASRSLQLHQQLAWRLEQHPSSDAALLRRVTWSLESGVKVPERQLLRASVHAARTFQNDAAISLATLLAEGPARAHAQLAASRAHFNAGRYAEAGKAYAEAAKALSEPVRAPENGKSSRRKWTGGAALLHSLLDHVLESSNGTGKGSGLAPQEREAGEVMAKLLSLDLAGDFEGLAGLLEAPETAAAVPDDGGPARAFLLALRADVLRAGGDPVQAHGLTQQAAAYADMDPEELFFYPEFVLYRKVAAALDAGDWLGAEEYLAAYEAESGAGLMTFGGTVQYFRGLSRLRQGHHGEAFKVLRPAVEMLRLNDPQQLLEPATAMAAYAGVRSGETGSARAMLEGFGDPARGGSGPDALLAPVFAAAAKEALDRDGAGIQSLQNLVVGECGRLPAGVELQALSLWLELGSAAAAQRTVEHGGTMSGAWASAWTRFATARGSKDVRTVLSSGDYLRALGQMRLARDCYSLALSLSESSGDRAAARQAAAGKEACDHALGEKKSTPAAEAPNPGTVQLTRRERDIIALAASGLSDRQIADKLMVSVRTVEGHLYRSYAKLGIRSREELSAAGNL
ncbi:LuxR C-terminal-related transcriptional regulator [Arthrobacter cupressi]